jgi:outer membrane biogenesis lipoprotein LolB
MKSFVIILISLSIIATGCSTLKPREEGPPVVASSPEAEALFNRLQSQNTHLHSFKGTGRLRIKDANGIQQVRLMWAGLKNEKLRLEIMGTIGQPIFSFACDGDRIYLISHTENRFYSKRESNANLEKLIALPITVSACLDLMAGRIPLETHLLPMAVQEKKESQQILVLESTDRKKGGQQIFIDASSGNVRRVEAYDRDEILVYRAEFVRMQHVSGFEVPRELRLSNDNNASLQLVVDRFWPNAPVAEDLFKLAKPVNFHSP